MIAKPWRAIIWYACIIHYTWGFLLATSGAATHATPVAAIATVFGGRWGAMIMLFAVAILAQVSDIEHKWWPMLVPQQFLMVVSAFGAIHAAWVGHYADGVTRPWQFITGDQLPVILATLLYTYALLTHRQVHE